MVRINHAASYFMPMFCSSKPYVVLLASLATLSLFVGLYMTSNLLKKQYDDPGLFKPNSQDYFRTSLLGVFSPILYYFVKTFLFNINRRYLVLNLLIDFPLNDWFILFIIVCLAYPQQDQTKNRDSVNLWHIIPRQSYIFGIAWSLGELIICVTGNLFNYQELSPNNSRGDVETLLYDANDDPNQTDVPALMRENITLSKCVKVRRNSSTISNNVYCSELRNHDYGSTRKSHHSSRCKQGKSNDPHSECKHNSGVDDTVVMIDPTDNSLRLTSEDPEDDIVVSANQKLTGKDTQWGKVIIGATNDSQITVKKFLPVRNKKDLFIGIILLYVVLLGNVLLTVGQSLIFSIYFIYVPSHEAIFTRVVNYFGKRTIQFFFLSVLVPFTTLNLFINTMIFFWHDLDDWFNNSLECPPSRSHYIARDYVDYYDSDLSLQRSRPGSIGVHESTLGVNSPTDPTPFMLMTSPSELHYYNSSTNEEYQNRSARVLAVAKNFVAAWKAVARKDSFILSVMFTWGSVVFFVGVISTIAP